ncbi:OmpA family protein [Chryseolinea lacunae]|uniref:OmpA family protein n=1 Tax=Chryseolinea lacunae TaxID=2801331 RepID=A0ABS1KMY6_9BACT|nr:OmpA family protein [Chryseolinea lacunae]
MFVILLTVAVNQASGQGQFYPYYYVVVGGFASQQNAERFVAQVHTLNYPARYGFNTNRKLFYVYVRVTKDKQIARETTYRLRLESDFRKAWIYNGPLEGGDIAKSTAEADKAETDEAAQHAPPTIDQPIAGKDTTQNNATQPITSTPSTPEPINKTFVFQLTTGADKRTVNTRIHVLDKEPDDHVEHYNANERITVNAPEKGKLVVVCNPLGYKLAKRTINFADPLQSIKGAFIGTENEVIIPITLMPIVRGDYIELENVKFFDKTAILTPASEEELTELLNLMANPRYKIRLFGHTSSAESGEITTMGSSTNFFALDPANKHGQGSAKELSRQRAEVVKAYLVSKGIAAGRIAIQGYGAVLAIYENADANNRIEVEIVRN